MVSFPNQKRIRVKKSAAGPFLQINLEDLAQATQLLNFSEFKLYLYIAGNKKDYVFDLSPQDFLSHFPMSRSSYTKAVAALIEKGYLVKAGENFYDFYSQPRQQVADTQKNI